MQQPRTRSLFCGTFSTAWLLVPTGVMIVLLGSVFVAGLFAEPAASTSASAETEPVGLSMPSP